MNAILLSSKKMDYCTPQDFFDRLNAEFHFTLDAAATSKSAKCTTYYTPETIRLRRTDSRLPGMSQTELCFAIRHMVGKLASGCAKLTKKPQKA